jgi:hypothetical protein
MNELLKRGICGIVNNRYQYASIDAFINEKDF